jgi:hypothetical protein
VNRFTLGFEKELGKDEDKINVLKIPPGHARTVQSGRTIVEIRTVEEEHVRRRTIKKFYWMHPFSKCRYLHLS